MSPNVDDISDAMMVGWFEYSNIGTLLNKYAGVLDDAQIKKLEKWNEGLNSSFNLPFDYDRGGNDYVDSMQNYIAAQQLLDLPEGDMSGSTGFHEGFNRLIRETNMYFLLPRKVGINCVRSR